MNLALLFDEDFVATDRAVLRGRRLAHLQSVIKVVAGDTVPVGRADGQLGTGEVIRLTDNEAELRVTLDQAPPPPLPLSTPQHGLRIFVYELPAGSLGLLLAGRGRLSEAVPELEQAARLLPQRARIHYNLGLAYQHLEKRSQALGALRDAARVEPETVDFHRALVIFYLQDQRFDEAWPELVRWIELSPGDPQALSLRRRIEGVRQESTSRAR